MNKYIFSILLTLSVIPVHSMETDKHFSTKRKRSHLENTNSACPPAPKKRKVELTVKDLELFPDLADYCHIGNPFSEIPFFPKSKKRYINQGHNNSTDTTPIPSYSCLWKNCGKNFNSTDEINDHVISHAEKNKWICEYNQCGYKPPYPSHMKNHIESIHTIFKQHECDKCNFVAIHKSLLDKHKRWYHRTVN